jgi:predicted CXXCH cytochrome family protein
MIHRFSIFLLFLVALPGSYVAQGQEIYEQEKCSLCHIRQSVFFDNSFALPGNLPRFDEERVCASCHNGAVRDSRDSLWRGAQHPAAVPGGKASPQKPCSGCHSPHGKGGWKVLAGTRVSLEKGGDALCTGCHGGYGSGSGGIHRSGFPVTGCSECHRAHGGVGKNLLRESSATLCLRCHPAMGSKGGGGHLVYGPSRDPSGGKSLPQCTSCHPVHRKERSGEIAVRKCQTCHPFSVRKEAGVMKSHPDEEKCLSCHSFHENSGKGGRGFRGRDMRPETLCGTCHPRQVAPSVSTGREKATHVTRGRDEGEDLCFRCHRFHGGAPGTRRLVSGKPYSCLDCHERQNTIDETAGIVLSHPVFERVEKGRLAKTVRERNILLGPAGEIVCRTCHSVHRSTPLTSLLAPGFEKAERCFWCHEGMRGKDHLPTMDPQKGPACEVCHRIHGIPGEGGEAWGTVCSVCHEKKQGHMPFAESRKLPRPPEMPGFDPKGRMVSIGGGISCPTCHDPHKRSARGKRLRKEYLSAGFLCSACHKDKETIALTPHDLRGIAGKSICEPCHLPHGGETSKMWGMKKEPDDLGNGACRSCHRENGMASPVPEKGHPVNMIVPRPLPDTFPLFGPAGERRNKGVLTCSTCHEVHGTGIIPQAGTGTGRLLRFAGTREGGDPVGRDSCLPCHAGERTIHGNARCLSCHPPHQERKESELCQKCHPAKPGGMARGHEAAGKGCAACHPMHEGDGEMVMEGRCVTCHPGAKKVRGTSHARTGEGTCAPCHPAHEDPPSSLVKRKAWEEVFPPDLPCLRCHNPKGMGPALTWTEHPKRRTKVPTTYGATVTKESPISMIGRLMESGRPLFPLFDDTGAISLAGRMGCLTCHDPHAGTTIKENGNIRSANGYLRDPSGIFLADVCTPCHREESAGHVRKFHELPRKTE